MLTSHSLTGAPDSLVTLTLFSTKPFDHESTLASAQVTPDAACTLQDIAIKTAVATPLSAIVFFRILFPLNVYSYC